MPEPSSTSNNAIELHRYLHRMRDTADLCEQMGVSRYYVGAMKFHGFKMPGGKASVHMAKRFILTCPDFTVTGRHTEPPPPRGASCGKSHAPASKNGRRKPSSATR